MFSRNLMRKSMNFTRISCLYAKYKHKITKKYIISIRKITILSLISSMFCREWRIVSTMWDQWDRGIRMRCQRNHPWVDLEMQTARLFILHTHSITRPVEIVYKMKSSISSSIYVVNDYDVRLISNSQSNDMVWRDPNPKQKKPPARDIGTAIWGDPNQQRVC